MSHSHQHDTDFGRAFAIGVLLNTAFIVAEVVFGLFSHSLSLLADAGHNLSDVMGLLMAWAATNLARRSPTQRFTYGLRRSSVLAALFNAILLLVSIGAIAWEAIRRIRHPEPVLGQTMIWVAAAGVVINGVTAWMFARGRKGDLNIRGAFLHMAADAAVSAGVVVAGIIILQTGWSLIDPISSLVIVVIILIGTWGLLARLGQSRRSTPSRAGSIPAAVKDFSRATSRRRRHSSSPRLGLEHDRDRLHRARRETRAAARRQAAQDDRARIARAFRDRAHHDSIRALRRRRLPDRTRRAQTRGARALVSADHHQGGPARRRPRHPHARPDERPAQADDRRPGQTDPPAHHRGPARRGREPVSHHRRLARRSR